MYLSINRGRMQKEGTIFPVSFLMLKFNFLPLNKPGPLPGIDVKIFCGKSNVFLLPIIFQKCPIGGQVAHCKFLESISGPSHSLQFFFFFYICLSLFFFLRFMWLLRSPILSSLPLVLEEKSLSLHSIRQPHVSS